MDFEVKHQQRTLFNVISGFFQTSIRRTLWLLLVLFAHDKSLFDVTFGMVFIFSHSVFKIIFRYSPPQVYRKLKIQDIVKKYRRERSVSDFYESLFFTNDAN